MANTAVVGSPKSARPPSWQVNKHFLPQSLNSNTKRLSETPSNIISRNPKRFILSGKPRNMFVTGKPRYMFLSLGKPRNFFHRQPFKTPPRKRDKLSKGDSNIQEPRQPSKKRSRFDSVEKHRERSVHQELKASQALKVRIRPDTVFEKENYSNCSLQKKGTLSKGVTTTSKGQGKRRKLSLGKNSKSLKCYTCGVFVKDAHFKEHLFFGESECTRCNLKIIDCQTFVENRIDCLMGNSLCSHTLRFTKKPSDYISNRLAQELPFEWDTSRRLASYISSLQKLKMIDPWKRAINQCQNFLDGEPSHVSEASEGHINASETATDFSFRQETVPTYEHESSNLPSPSLVNGDGDLVLSQSYNLEHLNEAVEYEVARDSPSVTREISPSSSESSGGNNITGSLLYPKANIDTVSESFKTPPGKRDKQSKSGSNIQEPRPPSKKRSRFDSVEKHRERSVHQELEAGQALKARVRLDTVFEKENYSNCSLQKKGTLSKGVTTTSKGQGKRRKLSLGKNSKSLKCYTCGVFVKDAHFEEHLFFGESECTRCNLKIINCQTFVENRIDCLMGNSLCSHTLRFTKKPSDYISNRLVQELPFEWDTSRRLASYISSLQKLKMIDPWKGAINQCQNFLDGEPSHVSEASEERINASETATDFYFRQETVPTYEHESSNLPSPSLVNGDGDLVLSQSYNLEHFNEAVEYEVARDSPLVTREISPSSSESSGGNNITGSLLYPKANIATVSESSVSKNASKGKSSSDISESLSSSNSHKTLKSLKTKSKAEKRSKARNSSKASKDVEKTFLETPSDGYYLVVRRAIEECPMCYTELCPSRFTVNVNTFLLSTVCIGCNLTIYIIFDPPDGSAPKIAIVTEEHSMKHKECKPKKKKTEYEGRTRVKDFFKK